MTSLVVDLERGLTLLTLNEAAARVRLSPWALRRAIKRGELHAFKPSGRIRISVDALETWLAGTTIEPQPVTAPASPRPLPRTFPPASDTFRARARRKQVERAHR